MTDIMDALKRKAGIVTKVLGTDDGKQLLQVMHDEFDMSDLRGDTVEETYYNLGRRDAIVYLEQLRDAKFDG
jgi:hypothetical protein